MSKQAMQYLAGLSQEAQRKEQERGIKPFDSKQQTSEVSLSPITETRRQSLSPELKQILDYTFETLWGANPAWRAAFKSKKEVINYKVQLGRAMEAAGVNTIEKVEDGLNYAIQQPGSFMPSTGDFVTWCKEIFAEKQVIKRALEKSNRINDEDKRLASDTWEERQAAAKSALSDIRKIVGSKQ